jgi:uncharacterized protein with NRDE domain
VLANRDEYHARAAAPLGPWAEGGRILGGRDLQAGGTWFGIDRRRRIGLVTNFRERARPRPDAPTRGNLVSGFLLAEQEAAPFLEALADDSPGYAGFNLLLADAAGLWYATNRNEPFARPLGDGVHALSNHVLDTPWPKVRRLRAALIEWLTAGGDDATPLWSALADRQLAAVEELPRTGVAAEWEHRLSAAFVSHGNYGTRCSTLLLLGYDGSVHLEERSFDQHGELAGKVCWRLRADEWP